MTEWHRLSDRLKSTDTPRESEPYPRPAYAWYVVAVLTLAYMFSFIDRQIISMMIGPIKRDFALSDAQVGFLSGTTFALFYTFFGLPVGRWADTRSRRALITAGFVLWSLMTAASGLAQKFWHLLLCRVGVGVGEATLSPAAYSLIADYFEPRRRATAIGVYSFGWIIALSGALGAVGGGRLADAWRSRGRADANLRVALLGAAVMAAGAMGYPLASSGVSAASWLVLLVIGVSAPFSVVAAAIQQLVPGAMRAQASALFLFVINLLGLGLGPLGVGWLSDRLSPDGQALHLALLVALVGGSLGAVLIFALGIRPYRRTAQQLDGRSLNSGRE